MIYTNENLLLWEQRINERNKSGMTVKEWNKYNYWNHKTITRKEKPVEEVAFNEVTPIFSNCNTLLSNVIIMKYANYLENKNTQYK